MLLAAVQKLFSHHRSRSTDRQRNSDLNCKENRTTVHICFGANIYSTLLNASFLKERIPRFTTFTLRHLPQKQLKYLALFEIWHHCCAKSNYCGYSWVTEWEDENTSSREKLSWFPRHMMTSHPRRKSFRLDNICWTSGLKVSEILLSW